MAYPVLESNWTTATTGGSTASSLVITAPASIVSGELLLIIAGTDDTGGGAGFNNITGFTKFDDRDTGNGAKLAGFWRTADETEGVSETISVTSNDEIWGWYARFSNVHATVPIYLTGLAPGTVANSTNHSRTNGATSINPENLSLTALAFDGGDGVPFVVSSGGSWATNTKLTDIQSGTSGNDASGIIILGDVPWIQGGVGRSIGITSSVSDGSNYFAVCIQSLDPPDTIEEINGITIDASRTNFNKLMTMPSQQVYNIFGFPFK